MMSLMFWGVLPVWGGPLTDGEHRADCERGHAGACAQLAERYDSRLLEACEGGAAEACRMLAAHLRDGPGVADPAQAGTLADRGCELGSEAACRRAPSSDVRVHALALSLLISAEGLWLRGAESVIGRSEGPGYCPSGACSGVNDFAWDALAADLAQVKRAHPELDQLIIVPQDDISAAVVLQAMQTVRGGSGLSPTDSLFPDILLAGGVK